MIDVRELTAYENARNSDPGKEEARADDHDRMTRMVMELMRTSLDVSTRTQADEMNRRSDSARLASLCIRGDSPAHHQPVSPQSHEESGLPPRFTGSSATSIPKKHHEQNTSLHPDLRTVLGPVPLTDAFGVYHLAVHSITSWLST